MRILLRSLPLLMIATLAGCGTFGIGGASDYSCPGMPNSPICKSPSQIYQMTHKSSPDIETVQQGAPDDETSLRLGKPAIVVPAGQFAGQPMPTTPILEPAKVMRIWIAPWQTKNEDLVWPSYVFVEVTPKKWSFGEMTVTNFKPFVPLQVDAPRAEAQQQQGTADQMQGVNPKMSGMPVFNPKTGSY